MTIFFKGTEQSLPSKLLAKTLWLNSDLLDENFSLEMRGFQAN